jgi:hypothetical protein
MKPEQISSHKLQGLKTLGVINAKDFFNSKHDKNQIKVND